MSVIRKIALSVFGLVGWALLPGYSQTLNCNTGTCTDPLCVFPATVEKGCNCFDGKDNDGNGKIDAADVSCASYYGLTFVGAGSSCSINPPPGTAFSTIAPPQTSSQNTADTPAKVVVGDINGDGVPDAAVCSKWNSTVQVVATANAGGFSAGDIMADFRTPGSHVFPKAGSQYVFEYEVLIADIDRDKKAEVFAIASERGGSPNNPPVRFFLMGFKYTVGSLVPMYNAIDLGTARPGNPGIADFDGDGKAEVYLKNRIYAAESGVLLADAGGNWATQINSGPVAANISGDSKLELICGNYIYSVPSLASRSLQSLTLLADMNTLGATKFYPKGFNDVSEYGKDQASSTSTADIDGDGFLDVLMTGAINCSGLEASPCGSNITTIFYWNVKKATVSTFAPPDTSTPDPNGWSWGTGRINLGDATGDGKLDALFVSGNSLYCLGLDAAGNLKQQWVRTINDSKSGILALTVYDFDNNGQPEVVYRDSQELVIVDGLTGQTRQWSSSCQSHTWTEGPIVADVNGDGNTDICITCNTNNSFNINAGVQQQSLGQIRLYYSSSNAWLPTRQVWNQHPYYVTNIKDDLTLPFPQIDPSLVFSATACPSGLPGPQRPLNLFMNQVPHLSKSGCPEFPAPDLTFIGDNPNTPGVDSNGDGVYSPTVVVIPPICGNVDIKAFFNIVNNGDLAITDNVPVSFFNGDPTANPVTATKLFSTNIAITNLQVGQTLVSPTVTFNGPGTSFPLYIVLYNNGSVLPITLTGQSTKECSISNNIYEVNIVPTPFTVTVEKLSDNVKCAGAPSAGSLRVHIFKGATEVIDYSPYTFQWYTGSGTASPIAGATQYNLTGLAGGTYSVVVTDSQKGCADPFVTGTIVDNVFSPVITVAVNSNQTVCNPQNGQLTVSVAGGSVGLTFTWFDISLTPLGITGPTANNLSAGSYVVRVSNGSCTATSSPATVSGPQIPDAQAQVLQNVVDCSNPNAGSIQADAYFNGVLQNPAGYTFDWYFYNNATSTRGSILPPANGSGQIRTGLPVGYYQAVIKDNTTQCVSGQTPIVQVTSQTVIPSAQIRQVTPQTSCDPTKPNGSLIADAYIGGVLQNPSGFTFQWFKGQNTLPANLVATVSGTNGQQVNQVAGGGIPYTVKIITAFNCSATAEFTVGETIIVPVLTLAQLSPNSVCDAAKATTPYNGSIQATVSFGGSAVTLPDPNYTFSWYDGLTTTTAHNPATSQSPTLSALKDGDYTAIVKRNDLFCTSTPQTQTVVKATVPPILSATSTGSNNCDPALTPDGTVTVAVTNSIGSDVFTYQWYKGNVVGTNPLGAANNGTSATAIKVGGPVGAPNPFTVYVLNKTTGCEGNTTQFVADNSVVPVLSTSVTGNGVCDLTLGFKGTMSVSVTNIPALYTVADYSFAWYDGGTTATLHSPQPAPPSATTLNNLDSKTFSVVGTNTKTGCISAITTNVVPNNKVFPSLAPAATGSNNCNPALTPDGTATVVASGTTGPYGYQWYIGGGDPIAGAFPKVPTAPNNGQSSTAIQLGGPTGAPHSYTALVTDTGTGCTAFATAIVQDNSVVPILSTSTLPNDICDVAKTFAGSMTVGVTNIPALYTIADYNFTWKNAGGTTLQGPSTATLLSPLDVGTYTVSAINTKTGCQSLVVPDQVADTKIFPNIQIATTGSHNCSNAIVPDGTATATVTNPQGADTYTYLWTAVAPAAALTAVNNPSLPNAIKLGGPLNAPNSYKVVVTDNRTGCVSNNTGQVADLSAKPTLTLQPFDNHVCDKTLNTSGQFDGHVDQAGVTNNTGTYAGTITYSYTWNDVTNATTLLTNSPATSITQLNGGNYSATVTITELGCTSDPVPAQVLNNFTIPAIVTATNPNVNCVGPNGSTQVATVDAIAQPNANYTLAWFNGATVSGGSISSNAILGINLQGPATNYTVQATNRTTGCQGNTPVTVVDSKVTPTISVSLIQNNTICDLVNIDPNGALLATPANAGASFTINWIGGVAPATIVGGDHYTKLKAGSYSANVINNNTGCQSTNDTQSIIDQLTNPAVAFTITDQTSCSVTPNGKIAVTNVAGDTYTWFDGIGTGGGTHIQNPLGSGIIDQLASGDYTLKAITTLTGCTTTQSEFVPNNVVNPTLSFVGVNPVTKCNSPDGSATASITGLSGAPKYDLFYVYTSTISGAAYPTDPTVVKASGDPKNIINGTTVPSPVAYGGMIPGYLTAIVVDKNSQCESTVVTQQITDNTTKSNITVTVFPVPGLCGGGLGGMDPVVTPLPAASYTYEWFVGTPTNGTPINFFTNPPAFATSEIYLDNGANLGIHHVPPDNSINAGTYTLVVKDPDGCGTYHTDNVPTSTIPVISIVPTDITRCDISNGQLVVKVTSGTSGTGYSIEIFSGNDAGGLSKGNIGLSPINTPLTVSGLAPGPYFIKVVDGDNPGCPLGRNQTLIKSGLNPIISDIITANTSCDPLITPDGKVQLTATSDATDVLAKQYYVSNISPAPVGFVAGAFPANEIGNGTSGQTSVITGFASQSTVPSYTITVTDNASKCATDLVVVVPDQQAVPSLLNLAITPETGCDPLSNGSAVTSLQLGDPINIFDFTWAQNNDLSGVVYGAKQGDGTLTGGEVINQVNATSGAPGNFWPMGAAGFGAGNRTFYVQGVKNSTAPTGVGCKTEIKQVVIPDLHVSPDMTLTPAFDSFCLATSGNNNKGDGKITIVADANPATGPQDIPAGGFNYDWTPVPIAAAPVPVDNSSAPSYVIGQLHDGNYTVTVTNATNQCAVSNSAVIDPAPYVITVDLTDPIIDQRVCNNDGWVRASQITLKDNSVGSPNSETKTNAAIDPLYSFGWYNNAALTAGTELKDGPGGTGTQILARTLSNDVDQIAPTDQAGDYQAMQAGTYYLIATRSDNTKIGFGCPSLPFRVDVKDVHVNPVPSLSVLSNTSCLPAGPGEGEISITVTDATPAPFNAGTYVYTWLAPGPIPANPPASNVNPGAGNGNGSSGDGDNDQYTQLIDNVTLGNANPYTVGIKNIKTGCTVNASATIIKNALPVFVQTVSALDQILCGPDGSLTVAKVSLNDRTGVSQDFVTAPGVGQGSIFDFDFKWTRSSSVFTQTTTGAGDNVLNLADYNAAGFGVPIGADSYTVTAVRNTGTPGAGCSSSPFPVIIQNKQILPNVTLTPFSNTSCDLAVFEGEIKIKVKDATTAAAPVGGFTFNYDWTGSSHVIPSSPSTGNNGNELNDGAGPDHDYEVSLQEGLYTVTVVNATTLCQANASTTIVKNATPVFVQNVAVVDQLICGPDGSLTISRVTLNDRNGLSQTFDSSTTPDLLTDFQFAWTRVGDANNFTEIMNSGIAPAGAVLNTGNYVVGAGGFAPVFGAGTYTVVAKRKAGSPGTNCASAPYTVVLQDKSIKPVVMLTPLANTSCDPGFFEGEIRVVVNDLTPVAAPAGGFKFDYVWTGFETKPYSGGTATTFNNNNGNGYGDPVSGELDNSAPPVLDFDGDHPINLKENSAANPSYVVQVTNTTTLCAASGTTTIFKNSTPVFTQQVTPTPQVLCKPDGQLLVSEVKLVDRNGFAQSNLTGDFPLSDFSFSYDRTTIGNTVLGNSASTQLDNVNYPTIGFDTYYVVATRTLGSPGLNCSSAPFKVDIADDRLFPKVKFSSLANSSCNVAKPNGSVTSNASEQDGTNAGPYTFAWTLNGGPLSIPPSSQTDTNNSSIVGNALDGSYIVTATNSNTGCPIAASFNLLLDQTRSTPNVIDVSTIDPTDCKPSASATVTKITLGSTFNSTTQPPNIAPDNTVTGAGLATFTYGWASGSPSNIIAGQTTQTINNLIPGSYFVSVQDPTTDCQSGPKQVDILDDLIVYPVVTIAQTVKQISCIATTGTAALAATTDGQTDANPNYTFTWYQSLDETGAVYASTSTITSLLVGNYSVSSTDLTSGCSATAAYIVPNDAPAFTPSISLGGTPRSLCVGQDGSVLVRVINIDPAYPFPYSFKSDLYVGATPNLAAPPDVPNMPAVTGFKTEFIETNLVQGPYTVRVTDNNTGCTIVSTEQVPDDRVYPVIDILLDNPLTNCDPNRANGQLSATADGVVGGYTFDWFTGSSIPTPAGAPLVPDDNKLIGQPAGVYVVRATRNVTGCFSDQSDSITNKTLTPPIPNPSVVQDRTSCLVPNGWVTVTVGGQVFGYDYSWYDGPSVTASPNYNDVDYTGRDIGPYTVTAKDQITGCISPPATVTVADKRKKPLFSFVSTPSYCSDVGKPKGAGTIQLTLLNSEDVVIDQVQWFQAGTTTQVGTGIEIYDLFPGLYNATVTSTEGCTNDGTAEVVTEINPYNGVSANGDGKNDGFIVDCISNFPNNNVKIFNRSGILVYEANGYNNLEVLFRGLGEKGFYLQGKELPVGTYFYIIDKRNGSKPIAGYLELDR